METVAVTDPQFLSIMLCWVVELCVLAKGIHVMMKIEKKMIKA